MTEPGENDPSAAHNTWKDKNLCNGPLEEVIQEFENHEILDDRVVIVQGDVRETLLIENNIPEKISILRLDTDWYDSTKIELEVLYNKLVPGGYLIIDDYGHWSGCAKAVDEFFGKEFVDNNFQKLDYTGRLFYKS
jgi:hypothetical protein